MQHHGAPSGKTFFFQWIAKKLATHVNYYNANASITCIYVFLRRVVYIYIGDKSFRQVQVLSVFILFTQYT